METQTSEQTVRNYRREIPLLIVIPCALGTG